MPYIIGLTVCFIFVTLQQWWKKGYGYPINYEQSCPILKDAVQHMDKAVQAAQSGDRSELGKMEN